VVVVKKRKSKFSRNKKEAIQVVGIAKEVNQIVGVS
jgi:hypothetical protein